MCAYTKPPYALSQNESTKLIEHLDYLDLVLLKVTRFTEDQSQLNPLRSFTEDKITILSQLNPLR